MNLKNLFHRIRNQINPQPEPTDEVVLKFLNILEQARRDDLSCTDIYARLDEFVETELQGADVDKISPLLHEHLDICSECCEEYEALLTVVEHTKDEKDGR